MGTGWRVMLVALLLSLAPSVAATAEPLPVPEPPPSPAPLPLPVLDAGSQPRVDPGLLRARLAPLAAAAALGAAPGVAVLDAATGEVLFDERAGAPLIPASTWKLATSLAVLEAPGPAHRLVTSVVQDSQGIVLVGGGDPTLATEPPTQPGYAPPASLGQLAQATATALAAAGNGAVTVRYDAELFSGPDYLPDWDPTFRGLGVISPVSALTLDQADPGTPPTLDQDPARVTAEWFVQRLNALGLVATLVGPGRAEASAAVVAQVRSAPMAALVDRMLDTSDNDVAEALFRIAAVNRGLPGSFEGGAQAVTQALQDLGAPLSGLVVRDGSGLSRQNRAAPITLAAALQASQAPQLPRSTGAGPTWAVPGLPVAGVTGSLAQRFADPDATGAAGQVRAKTGTLSGVSGLVGLAQTDQGRPLVFAALANDTPSTEPARVALDRLAAAVAGCGCVAAPS